MSISIDQCACEVLEVMPLIMRAIRTQMRRQRAPELSLPQFRALAFINRHPGVSLSDVAEHIGLTLPSMSKLIDGLVARQLVSREISPDDRRYVTLALTESGQTTLQSTRAATQAHLAQLLAALPDSERVTIVQAMLALCPIFTPGHELEPGQTRALIPDK